MPATTNTSDKPARQRLLKKMRQVWIEGVLEPSLHNTTPIDVNLYAYPGAGDYTWETVLKAPQPAGELLPPGTNIIDVFDKQQGSLLILGAPGAGKTTMLLQLARALIERAEQDETQPVPVIISATAGEQSLGKWLSRKPEDTIYSVRIGPPVRRNRPELVHGGVKGWVMKNEISQSLIDNGQILLLLDDLNEVKQEHRTVCIEAINTYHQKYSSHGLVVCSRITEYHTQEKRLDLHGTVALQPLTLRQVDKCLSETVSKHTDIRAILYTDSPLCDAITTPRMLNIVALVYQDISIETLQTIHSNQEHHSLLAQAYVQRVLTTQDTEQEYTAEETRHWLKQLTKLMTHSKWTFFPFHIEYTDDKWLPNRISQIIYYFMQGFGYLFVLMFLFALVSVVPIVIHFFGEGEPALKYIIAPLVPGLVVFSLLIICSSLSAWAFSSSQHYALSFTRYIPWNYKRFLYHATKLNLLYKRGDGYAFIHPTIKNYFAKLDVQQPQDTHVEDEQDVLNKRKELLGYMHPDTARSFNNYGMTLCASGDYDAAQKHLEHAVNIRFTLLGAYHPSTATSLNNLGIVHQYNEDYESAQPLLACALDIRTKELGTQHIETAESMHNLAMNSFYRKDFAQAHKLFEQVLAIREQTLGHDHAATALSRAGMGLVLQEQGHLEEALPHLDNAFHICEQTLGSDNPETIMCLSHLALLLWEKGEDRAGECFETLEARLVGYIEQTQPSDSIVVDSIHTIIADMQTARTSQSKLTRSTSLNRIMSDLAKMPHLITGLHKPQQLTIKRITDRWREVVSREAGRVGKLEQKQTVVSPYIFTAPVEGAELVGREDIFQEITRSWAREKQRDSLLIHGHRRVGKTSVAQSLAKRCKLGDDTHLIYISVDGIDRSSEGYLYFEIAFRLAMTFDDALAEPELEPFLAHFDTSFNLFLAQVDKMIGDTRIIVVLDEFETWHTDTHNGVEVAQRIITYLRSKTQTYPWLTLALVGLSDLDDLRKSYRNPLLGWKSIRVGFLEKDYVANVLNNPAGAPDFPLEYSRDAQEMIAKLTSGQPYLVQVIGDLLVERYNTIVFTKQQRHSNTFEVADVQAVVNDPDFHGTATAYFEGIWDQTITPREKAILLALATQNESGTDELTLTNSIAELDDETFIQGLDWLLRHDILCRAQANGTGTIRFSVPLMYRWVRDTQLHTIEALA